MKKYILTFLIKLINAKYEHQIDWKEELKISLKNVINYIIFMLRETFHPFYNF